MSTRKYNYKGKDVYLQKELKELNFIPVFSSKYENELFKIPSK